MPPVSPLSSSHLPPLFPINITAEAASHNRPTINGINYPGEAAMGRGEFVDSWVGVIMH